MSDGITQTKKQIRTFIQIDWIDLKMLGSPVLAILNSGQTVLIAVLRNIHEIVSLIHSLRTGFLVDGLFAGNGRFGP